MTSQAQSSDPFTPPNASQARAHRDYAALFRIAERHASTDSRRHRHLHASVIDPHEAVRLVLALAAGGALPEPDEDPIDNADLIAALTLIAHVRADIDVLEAGLISSARAGDLTWQEIAFGLGLGTPQAARQRFERLTERTEAPS